MTTISFKRLLLTAVVALAPVFTACERADDLTSAGPSRDLLTDDVSMLGAGGIAGVPTSGGQRDALRQTVADTGSVSTWLTGGHGQTLELKGYKLSIPAGARSGQTLYVMSLVPIKDPNGNTYQLVRLKAFDKNGFPVRTFSLPLSLTVPFTNADPSQLIDPSRLRLGYVIDGTTVVLEVIRVTVDSAAGTMTGNLTHFSDYTPILD